MGRIARKDVVAATATEQRLTVASLHLQGLNMRTTRSPVTIVRELFRNESPIGCASVLAVAPSSARRHVSYETTYAPKKLPVGTRLTTTAPSAYCLPAPRSQHARTTHTRRRPARTDSRQRQYPHARPKSKINCWPATGKPTSSREPTTTPPSAFWSNGPAVWCCSPRWRTPPQRQHWQASPLNSQCLRLYAKTLPTTR